MSDKIWEVVSRVPVNGLVDSLPCPCPCHPEYLMCKKCILGHDVDALLSRAEPITFENEEVKRAFINDVCYQSKGDS